MNKSRIAGLSCFIFNFFFFIIIIIFFFWHFVKIIVQLPHHRITIAISTTETVKIRLQLKLKSTWNTFTPIGLFLHIYFKIQYNTIQCIKKKDKTVITCVPFAQWFCLKSINYKIQLINILYLVNLVLNVFKKSKTLFNFV